MGKNKKKRMSSKDFLTGYDLIRGTAEANHPTISYLTLSKRGERPVFDAYPKGS